MKQTACKYLILVAALGVSAIATAQTAPTTPATQPALVTPPTVDQSSQIAAALVQRVNGEMFRRVQVTEAVWNFVWNNKSATPDAIVAKLGNQAGLVFGLAQENVAHISRAAALAGQPLSAYLPAQYQTTPRTVTVNSDGTVTLGPVPSS
jgi:hypothetical protein